MCWAFRLLTMAAITYATVTGRTCESFFFFFFFSLVRTRPLSENDKPDIRESRRKIFSPLSPSAISRSKALQLPFRVHSGTSPAYAIGVFGRFFRPQVATFRSLQAHDGSLWCSFTMSLQPSATPTYHLLLQWYS